jgi:hypothetical protein
LDRGCCGTRDTVSARERRRLDVVEPDDPDDFFDEVSRSVDVASPAGNRDGPVCGDGKAEAFENRPLLIAWHVDSAEPRTDRRIVGESSDVEGWCPGPDDL